MLYKNYKKTLYFLEEKIKGTNLSFGICYCMNNVEKQMSNRQFVKMKNHFIKNQPSKNLHTEFLKNSNYIGTAHWWQCTSKGHEQRIAFLQKMIIITTPWYVTLYRKFKI